MVVSKNELPLTTEHVNQILELRLPESVFYWRVGNGRAVKAGSKAGCLRKDGYTVIRINGSQFLAHRLVWLVTYGKFPEGDIDHIDGDRPNNQVENLRDVSNKVNSQNKKKRSRRDTELPTGVRAKRNKYDEIIAYRAYWNNMNDKCCATYFGIKEWHTLEAALAAAIARRDIEMVKLKDLGAAYTTRHGTQ